MKGLRKMDLLANLTYLLFQLLSFSSQDTNLGSYRAIGVDFVASDLIHAAQDPDFYIHKHLMVHLPKNLSV